MTEPNSAVPETIVEQQTKRYPLYKVFVHNDDETPYNVVVSILIKVFNFNPQKSKMVAEEAHRTGVAFVGAYTFEQAEFKVEQAHTIARANAYPLTFTLEPE